jgi:hypothetical protein
MAAPVAAEGRTYDHGYTVRWRSSTALLKRTGSCTCHGVVFAGGVLGTVKLLAALAERAMSRIRPKRA